MPAESTAAKIGGSEIARVDWNRDKARTQLCKALEATEIEMRRAIEAFRQEHASAKSFALDIEEQGYLMLALLAGVGKASEVTFAAAAYGGLSIRELKDELSRLSEIEIPAVAMDLWRDVCEGIGLQNTGILPLDSQPRLELMPWEAESASDFKHRYRACLIIEIGRQATERAREYLNPAILARMDGRGQTTAAEVLAQPSAPMTVSPVAGANENTLPEEKENQAEARKRITLEELAEARSVAEFISDCDEQLRKAEAHWQNARLIFPDTLPGPDARFIGLPQQQNLLVGLLTAIQRGSESTLRSWAALAYVCGCSREQFASDVQRRVGHLVAESVFLHWTAATTSAPGIVIVPSEILPLGMWGKPDVEIRSIRERCRAVASGELPPSAVRVNWKALDREARIHGEALDIPGVRAVRLDAEEAETLDRDRTQAEMDEYLATLGACIKSSAVDLVETLALDVFDHFSEEVRQTPAPYRFGSAADDHWSSGECITGGEEFEPTPAESALHGAAAAINEPAPALAPMPREFDPQEFKWLAREVEAALESGDLRAAQSILRLLECQIEGLPNYIAKGPQDPAVQIEDLAGKLQALTGAVDELARQNGVSPAHGARDEQLLALSAKVRKIRQQVIGEQTSLRVEPPGSIAAEAKPKNPTVGQLILEARELATLTQDELAEKLSAGALRTCDRGTIIDWEKDRIVPRPKSLRKISTVLPIPLEKLAQAAKKARKPRKSHAKPC